MISVCTPMLILECVHQRESKIWPVNTCLCACMELSVLLNDHSVLQKQLHPQSPPPWMDLTAVKYELLG